ncbi:MAG: ABC transporter substrate-binding protein [Pseudolabrys sp.]|nr:ABC transporter substrate-binding protein [Pseudolabrys sp.]
MLTLSSILARKLRPLGSAIAIGTLAATLALNPQAAVAQTAPPVTVTAAVIGVSISIWPAIVANEKKFFEEEGIKLDIVSAGASARALQQVAAGVAQVGSSSMVDTVRAIDAGAEVKVFTNSLAVATHSLLASKDIKSVKDLKGKRIMTGGQGDITNLWWKAMAKHHGLDPEKDVQLLYSGSSGSRMSALLAGGVDATILSTPQSFKAAQEGMTDLGPVAPFLGEFPMMIWHVNDDWAKKNEKLLVAFVKAHNKAVRYMSEPANRQEVSEMLAKASNSGLDDALKSWDISMKVNSFVPDGAVAASTVDRVTANLLESGDIKAPAKPASVYYDGRYVQSVGK